MHPSSILAGLLPCLALSATASQVVFHEVMYNPQAGKPEYIEVLNLTSNRIDTAKWVFSGGIDFTMPDFNAGAAEAHFLKEYERIVISSADEAATRAAYPNLPPNVRVFGPWTGSLANDGDTFVLKDAAGALQCELSYRDGGLWPRAADGTGHSLQLINTDRKVDDWRNWRAGSGKGGTPGYVQPASAEEAVSSPEVSVGGTVTATQFNDTPGTGSPAVPAAANPGDTQWRFYNQLTAPPADWMQPAFNDATWGGSGFAPLGTENVGAPFIGIRTQVPQASGLATYYFRTTFNWSGSLTGNSFVIDQVIDDGVIYYLNGQEIGRDRMPNPEGHASLADPTAVGDATLETAKVSGSASSLDGKLVAGVNVFAASVHQNQTSSSDHVFAARLKITSSAPPGVTINEIKPGAAGAGFVEFYNPTGTDVDLQGYYLSDNAGNLTKSLIAGPLVVPAMGFAVAGYSESGLSLASPVVVILTRPDGTTRQAHISSSMTVDGRSLGRKPAGGSNWYLFTDPTPGNPNASLVAGAVSPIRLSEVHFDTAGTADWVELYNAGAAAQSLAGIFVSTVPDLSDKTVLSGSIAAGGYASVDVNFAPDTGGDMTLYLSDAGNNVLAAVDVERRAGFSAVQTWPAGGREWYAAATATRDEANNPSRNTGIVINEIMYDPPSKHSNGEYIELLNNSAAPVDISGWRFNRGIDYVFPSGTVLAAGEYAVVAGDPARITAVYGGGVRVFGPVDGGLANSGDYLRLEDATGSLADEVDYRDGGDWPALAAGQGSSLELLHPDMDNSAASSWRASNESNKSTFLTYTHTGIYRQLRGAPTVDTAYKELLLNLVSDGYVILDNITLTRAAAPATNLLPNGDATSHGTGTSANGFLCMGTHRLSDTIGGQFHLISAGGGDTKANKAEVDVTGMQQNDTLTLSFSARWVSGMPLLVAQTWDRSFGKVFRFPIPDNLGSPGAANSVLAPSAPASVDQIRHSPPVPTSTQPVVVTARVSSAATLSSVVLRERIDTVAGNGVWNSLPMNDSGTGGDESAGDGIWSATVAPRGDGTITQFYVRATTVGGQVNECPRQAEGVAAVNGSVIGVYGRPAMWIADNSPPSTQPGLLTERYIFSQYDRNAMNTGTGFSAAYDWDFPRMSNFGLNSTMIFNETDIIYGCELRKGGSPWTRVGDNRMERARWRSPSDNLFRDRSKNAIDSDGSTTNTAARFHNRITRYMMYLLGYPAPDSEFVQLMMNADAPAWREEMEMTDSDFFDRAYGDGGELYEIDDAWFMYDTNNHDDRLDAGSVTGRWSLLDWSGAAAGPSDESPIFFHGNWPIRFPEGNYDYASLSSFIKTVFNNNSTFIANEVSFQEQTERMIDVEHAGIYAAVRGYIGDWDNFTLNRGKNGYFYRRPTDGKFEFHHWDSDLGFQNTNEGFLGGAGGTGWQNLRDRPWFRRAYAYYLTELVTKYTRNSARMNAWLNAMNYQAANSHANAPFKTSSYDYPGTWFANREANAINSINSFGGTNYTRPFSISSASGLTVATPLISIAGAAPSTVQRVEVVNHPEAQFFWSPSAANLGQWTISGIALTTGLNTLTVRSLSSTGAVLNSLIYTVTLSVNAPPVVVITEDPASRRVAANAPLLLDASGSFDPEGTALLFNWTVTPSAGTTLTYPAPGKAQLRCTIPGIYTVELTVTDGAALSTVRSRGVTVFNAGDFQSFGGGDPVAAGFSVQNVEQRDNFSPSSWYSLEDTTGRLLVQVLDDSAKPLAQPSFSHPLITRDLPDTSDFVLQTELEPDTREFGNWQSGLWLTTVESGTTVRYAFSIDGGLNAVVRRAVQPAAWSQLASAAVTGSGATLRIRRSGTSLVFQRSNGDDWTTVFTQSLAAGSTAGSGGIFVATSQATTVRISFDYLLVADPATYSAVLAALRITELHFNPAAGGVEFVELRNTGASPITLSGVAFDAGAPFAMAGAVPAPYTFGAETLAPGEFIVVPENTAAFQSAYGTAARLAPAWTDGNLSNGGERIVLRDAPGNVIHDFTYDDAIPWPLAADGTGPSMEVISISGDYGDGLNWRASGEATGSPGYLGAGPDSDGDGYADSIEALFGTSSGDSSSSPAAASTANGAGHVTVTWPFTPAATYRVEYSTDLVNWAVLQTVTGAGAYTDTATPANVRRYYRVAAVLQ